MKRFLSILCAALLPAVALAQGFPSKVVKITTPYSSGIGPDLFMRSLAEVLQK